MYPGPGTSHTMLILSFSLPTALEFLNSLLQSANTKAHVSDKEEFINDEAVEDNAQLEEGDSDDEKDVSMNQYNLQDPFMSVIRYLI
jgi:hypothetical protein